MDASPERGSIAMSTLEREIIEKFHQLDQEARRRVRQVILQETEAVEESAEQTFRMCDWLEEVEQLRRQIRERQGEGRPALDVVGLLRSIRDGEDE
jgi:uncharacterized protein YecA (UPF0149 family)